MAEKLDEEVAEMCNLSKGVEEKGYVKSRVESIQAVMKNLNVPAVNAMKILQIPEEEWEFYRSLLKQ